jgi:pyridinium-3,5-bisthiocarboxylic acid mononucleotide nickel chelatase
MRAVYLDPVGGAAGDMILAALLDAGAPAAEVESALRTLPLPRESFALQVRRVVAGGLHATQITVDVHESAHEHGHGHGHGHGRTLGDILSLLHRSRLPGRAAERAAAVFQRLAAAEARVHAAPIAEVHFHEVGAIDAIVDITGAAIALELLGAETLRFGTLAPGHGIVHTAHGPLPIPAPATLELLQGVPIQLGGPPGEWVTPTAAAILTALGAHAPAGATMTVDAIGIGAGQRERADRPNVVRALVGPWSETAAARANGAGAIAHESVVVLESALDDLSPAALAHAVEGFRAAGALDVHLTAITMKKGRLGTLVTVLAPEAAAEALAALLLRSTTALGLRMRREERRILRRSFTDVETPYGPVRMKETERPSAGGATIPDAAPEADDVARAAARHGVSFAAVAAAAKAAWDARSGERHGA